MSKLITPYSTKQTVIQLNFKFFTIRAKVRLVYAILFNKIATIPIDGGNYDR